MRIDTARTAGLLYLTVVLCGIFSLAYVPSRIAITDDPQATIAHIRASATLFRLGILSGIVCYTAFLLLPLTLYRLLHSFGRDAATSMVVLAVVSVPLALVGVGARFALLGFAHQDVGTAPKILTAEIATTVRIGGGAMLLAQVFWGLWLFPLGYLIVKSSVIPRLLGVLLMLGCFGYVLTVVETVMIPDFSSIAAARWLRIPGSIGEIGTCLWLVAMGARSAGKGGDRADLPATSA